MVGTIVTYTILLVPIILVASAGAINKWNRLIIKQRQMIRMYEKLEVEEMENKISNLLTEVLDKEKRGE